MLILSLKFNSKPLDIIAISLIFTEERTTPSAGLINPIENQMETNQENVGLILTSPPENDFVNFQLGEFTSRRDFCLFDLGILQQQKLLHVRTTSRLF